MVVSLSVVLICLVLPPPVRSSRSQWRRCQCGSRGPTSWGGRTGQAARPSTVSWSLRSVSECPRPSTSGPTWRPTLTGRWLLNPVMGLCLVATSTTITSPACQRMLRPLPTLLLLLCLTSPVATTATEGGTVPGWERRQMITATRVRTGGTTCITAVPKITMAVTAKRGRTKGPAAKRGAGGITIRTQWTTAEVEESRARESIGIIIHTSSPEGATGLWTVEGGESGDPATKMDVHLTGMGIRFLKETVVSMEKGGGTGTMDPEANPQWKEKSPLSERRRTVTGKNLNICIVDALFSEQWLSRTMSLLKLTVEIQHITSSTILHLDTEDILLLFRDPAVLNCVSTGL